MNNLNVTHTYACIHPFNEWATSFTVLHKDENMTLASKCPRMTTLNESFPVPSHAIELQCRACQTGYNIQSTEREKRA